VKKRFWPYLACVVSALLLWDAFPPRTEGYAVFFALAPMLVLARTRKPAAVARVFFFFGLLYWLLTLSWMPAIIANGGPWPLVFLGWFALDAYCALFMSAFGWLAARAWGRCRPLGVKGLVLGILAEAVFFAGTEYARGTLFGGFGWNFLAVAPANAFPSLVSPAAIGGAHLVSALVVLFNGVVTSIAMGPFARSSIGTAAAYSLERWPARFALTGLPLLVVLAFLFAGRQTIRRMQAVETDTLRVAVVQRNMPCIFAVAADRPDPFAVYAELLARIAPAEPDLLLLPESAMMEFGGRVTRLRVQAAAAELMKTASARTLLAGGDDAVGGRVYNAAALYSYSAETQLVTDVYHKAHLVPFGEFIPLDKTFTSLQKLSPIGVSCWPGETDVFRPYGSPVRIAPLICYEDTDASLARKAARQDANLIALITNDAWFGGSAETVQHAAQSVLRAVETGLPLVRCGNTGVSGVVRPDGKTDWLASDEAGLKPFVDGAATGVFAVEVPREPVATPYVKYGDEAVCMLFIAGLALLVARRRKGNA